jgi:hypothetical protein
MTNGRMETTDILNVLPHRFLLVDRVIDMDGDSSATGIKNLTIVVVAHVDSNHVCLLLSASTLVFCLKVTIRPGRLLIASS